MKKGIIFDMDGTLWDSSEGVAKSWTRVVNEEYDRARVITTKDMQKVMGKTMDKIAEILFTAHKMLAILRIKVYNIRVRFMR